MKLEGFIGQAYTLDSLNVDAQRCVNLYPELIESGRGKEGQVAYLRATPGLEKLFEVGDGPIRCIHVDSIGRVFVVSGSQIFALTRKALWQYRFDSTIPGAKTVNDSDFNGTTDAIACSGHNFITGLAVKYTGSSSGNPRPPQEIGVTYYAIRVDDNNFALALTFADAIAGVKIDQEAGSTPGVTHTFTPQAYAPLLNVKHSEIDFTSGSFRSVGHGMPDGLAIEFKASGPVPGGISEDTTYYVTGRTGDSFKLASSRANALSGTAITLSDVDDQWWKKVLGGDGLYGGDTRTLSSAEGTVKAASMSFGGDGTDSSTIFVDGKQNYLFKDNLGDLSFDVLGTIDIAQVVFDITNDITLFTAIDVANLVLNGSVTIRATNAGVVSPIWINFYTYESNPNNYRIDIDVGTLATFTTADLITYITTGAVEGKDIRYNDVMSPDIGESYHEIFPSFANIVASGGGSQAATDAFPYSPATTEAFAASTYSGGSDGAVPTATDITWSDGYFILIEGGTNRFRVSDLQSFNLDALSFASSEGSPDIALALTVLNRHLYILNEKTTEVYANTGNADFPFERIQGGFIEVGILAPDSLKKTGNSFCFLGRQQDGAGIVFAMSGAQPQRISTHAIEQAINSYADPSSATAYSYQLNGHTFYVLNFAEATWVYDLSTQMWHERGYLNEGELERHRVECCAYVPSQRMHLVGDHTTNEVYVMREDVYSDDGDEILRMRSSPHISADGNRLHFPRFQLDMETGVGLDGDVQGSNPTVMLDWSDDGGHTWSSEQFALADVGGGQIGDFKKRVVWRRLGTSRDRIFRIKITDPVKVRLINASIDVEARSS